MKIDNETTIDIDAVERQAHQLRAEFTAEMLAAARTWIISKFSSPTLNASKTA